MILGTNSTFARDLRSMVPTVFSMTDFFTDGRDGVALDMLDPRTWYTDLEMTQPVTEYGQRVMAIRDISGNGYHATDREPQYAPIVIEQDGALRIYFDGSNMAMQIGKAGDFRYPDLYYALGLSPTFEVSSSGRSGQWGIFHPTSSESPGFNYANFIDVSSNRIITTTRRYGDQDTFTDIDPSGDHFLEFDSNRGYSRLNNDLRQFNPFSLTFASNTGGVLTLGNRGDYLQTYQGMFTGLLLMNQSPVEEELIRYRQYFSKRTKASLEQ